jgi:3'(2'), 5'-bisphosphate nucleotidase
MQRQLMVETKKYVTFPDQALMAALTAAVAQAACATLDSACSKPEVRFKADRSPVTDADLRSQAILLAAVAKLMPGVDVVSEEMESHPTRLGDIFVLIDPLDGTKEYVAGSSEYTVNLAVMRAGVPLAGIVAVPAEGALYRGVVGLGAERLALAPDGAVGGRASPIGTRKAPGSGRIAAVSRSHLDGATVALLDRLGITERIPCGSALKFCRVAEGAADIYPRLATTCEWDVAAGHALVVAAGGTTTLPDGGALRYGASEVDFRIPAFIAWGDRAGVLGAA